MGIFIFYIYLLFLIQTQTPTDARTRQRTETMMEIVALVPRLFNISVRLGELR